MNELGNYTYITCISLTDDSYFTSCEILMIYSDGIMCNLFQLIYLFYQALIIDSTASFPVIYIIPSVPPSVLQISSFPLNVSIFCAIHSLRGGIYLLVFRSISLYIHELGPHKEINIYRCLGIDYLVLHSSTSWYLLTALVSAHFPQL